MVRIFFGIVLVASACNGKRSEQEKAPVEPVVAQPVAPRSVDRLGSLSAEQKRELFRSLPASQRAGRPAPPREAWACAFDVDESQGISARGRSVFRYGDRTSCLIPHSIVTAGVYGCPEAFERTDTDGMVRVRRFEYDEDGRMVAFDGGNVIERFTWDGDQLVSVSREQWGIADVATYREYRGDVLAIDASEREQQLLRIEDGRLVEVAEYVHGLRAATARVEWAGDRPARVDVSVHGPVMGAVWRRLVYDCAE